MPQFITESNISWNTAESFVDLFGALWLGDYVGAFLTAGGKAVYYFHYLPMGVHRGGNNSMGTFGMFTTSDKDYQILQPQMRIASSSAPSALRPSDRAVRGHPDVKGGHSHSDGPAAHTRVNANAVTWFDVPQASMRMIREQSGNGDGER